jgi:uncharacterized membrane protein
MSEPLPPPTAPPAGGVSPNRAVMLVLSYLGILALVPLLSEKEDREVQWHARHGLVLLGAWVALGVGIQVFLVVLRQVAGGADCLGCLLSLAMPGLLFAYLAVAVLCMFKALNGQRLLIPGISQLADKF